MKPIDAKSNAQICKLKRDNVSTAGFWLLIDGPNVTLAKQKVGESAEQMLSIPRSQFDKLARWYVTGKMTAAKRRRGEGPRDA